MPDNATTLALVIDQTAPTTLYVGTFADGGGGPYGGGGVFKSTDGGASWGALTTGLTAIQVNALAIDPTQPTTLYAGPDEGGVFSIQQIATCVGNCEGTGTVAVNDLIALANIAFGTADAAACSNGGLPIGGEVDVAVIIQAVNNALTGCHGSSTPAPTPTPTPPVSLEVSVERTPGAVKVTASLTNRSDHALFYLAGCSARCRPLVYRALSFEVRGPDGTEVIVGDPYYPCSEVLACPEFAQQISPGESLQETLEIDGTAWQQQGMVDNYYCGVCTAEPFAAGRYTVAATSSYSTDPQGVYAPTGEVKSTLEFDWP